MMNKVFAISTFIFPQDGLLNNWNMSHISLLLFFFQSIFCPVKNAIIWLHFAQVILTVCVVLNNISFMFFFNI